MMSFIFYQATMFLKDSHLWNSWVNFDKKTRKKNTVCQNHFFQHHALKRFLAYRFLGTILIEKLRKHHRFLNTMSWKDFLSKRYCSEKILKVEMFWNNFDKTNWEKITVFQNAMLLKGSYPWNLLEQFW